MNSFSVEIKEKRIFKMTMNTITCKQIYTLKNVNCDIKNIKYVEKSKNLELLYVIKDKLLLAHVIAGLAS